MKIDVRQPPKQNRKRLIRKKWPNDQTAAAGVADAADVVATATKFAQSDPRIRISNAATPKVPLASMTTNHSSDACGTFEVKPKKRQKHSPPKNRKADPVADAADAQTAPNAQNGPNAPSVENAQNGPSGPNVENARNGQIAGIAANVQAAANGTSLIPATGAAVASGMSDQSARNERIAGTAMNQISWKIASRRAVDPSENSVPQIAMKPATPRLNHASPPNTATSRPGKKPLAAWPCERQRKTTHAAQKTVIAVMAVAAKEAVVVRIPAAGMGAGMGAAKARVAEGDAARTRPRQNWRGSASCESPPTF